MLCSVPNTPLHKMIDILFKNLQIGMKIHIWIAKRFLKNTENNNSILLEVLASVFTVSSNFSDNPRIL